MCPICIGTAALLLSGASSAGGLAAAITWRPVRRARALRERREANNADRATAEPLRQSQRPGIVPQD
jgi:hypothetical protein